MSYNRITLAGRLGHSPELKYTTSNNAVCELSLATTESWTKDGQKQERTDWHKCVCWGKTAELAERYLQKGRMVLVEGKLQYEQWQDKEGNKRTSAKIQVDRLVFLDSGKRDDAQPSGEQQPSNGGSRGRPAQSDFREGDERRDGRLPLDDDIDLPF